VADNQGTGHQSRVSRTNEVHPPSEAEAPASEVYRIKDDLASAFRLPPDSDRDVDKRRRRVSLPRLRPVRPHGTSTPFRSQKAPRRRSTRRSRWQQGARWHLRSLTYSRLRSCQNPLFVSAGTAPSHKSRTRSNRPVADATSHRSRYICRRIGRHQSAWVPIWRFRNAGR
jgi:hypothetical protein